MLFLSGCDWGKVKTYDTPYVEDNLSFLYFPEHKDMCNEKPESMFCINSPSIGTIKPTGDYCRNIVRNMNTEYEVSRHWHYTETIYEFQIRDCEDEAMTMIHHMVDEGIDKKYLFMVYQLTAPDAAHIFIGVDTTEGLMHMDMNTEVAPIEDKINWHMPMTNVGTTKWVKGNIK